jgi:DNA-directed RNA polymerase sigma subunit (sigma70/sigma32)
MTKKTKTKKQLVDQRLHNMVMKSRPEQTFTYQQIAEVSGLSHERVRQIELEALAKVKKITLNICREDGIEYRDLFHF